MRLLVVGGLALACMGQTAARADEAPPPVEGFPAAAPGPPLSIWRTDERGNALHRQSGLVCPPQFRSYQRTGPKSAYGLSIYDRYGLDVSCNYLHPHVADITVYLTRRSGTTVADAIAEAQRELLQVRADSHPQLVSESHKTVAGLDFDVTLYDVHVGRDTIWMADLDGWTLEYRLTYNADLEAQALADVTAMTEQVEATAGRRLDACAKSSAPPDRTGVVAPLDDHSQADALMTAIAAASAFDKKSRGEASTPPRPILWCPDKSASAGELGLLFWRGVYEDGSDAGADKVTATTTAEPVALVAASDPGMALIDQQLNRPKRWQATVSDASGAKRLYGFFTARPTLQALGALYVAILRGQAHALSGFDPSSHKITISAPAK